MAEDKWSHQGFSRLRVGIALILLEEEGKTMDVFFSYTQLAEPSEGC